MPIRLFLLLSFMLPMGLVADEPIPEVTPSETAPAHPPVKTQDVMTYTDAVILGAVEGLTEYLPISSTGHLILTNAALGLNTQSPIEGHAGIILQKDGTPLTVQEAADAYAIVIQAGAIAAVILIYWRRLLGVLMGFLGKSREGLLLGRNLIVAFMPAAVLGLLLDDLIEEHLFGIGPVAIALAAGSILMVAAEQWRKRRGSTAPESGPDLHQMSILQCLFIGLMQSVAMWPGTSRSMMTIVGGYFAGLSPTRAAEFSFLLGLITLTAAAGYTVLKHGSSLGQALEPGPALVGILVATITAALAVKWLVSYLSRHGLAVFAWYRLALAGILLLVL